MISFTISGTFWLKSTKMEIAETNTQTTKQTNKTTTITKTTTTTTTNTLFPHLKIIGISDLTPSLFERYSSYASGKLCPTNKTLWKTLVCAWTIYCKLLFSCSNPAEMSRWSNLFYIKKELYQTCVNTTFKHGSGLKWTLYV